VTATSEDILPGTMPRPRPHQSPFTAYDPVWLLVVNLGVIASMWVTHGGIERIPEHGWLIAIGQLSGLYAAIAVLLGLVLISRAPWLEHRYGMDQMLHFHRYVGFSAATLMIVHVLTVTVGYARDIDITLWEQIVDSVLNYPYVLGAVLGFGILMVVAGTSLRMIRRRLSYEHWWFVHLGAYAGVALAFGHQTAVGSDFTGDWWAFGYWSLLYLSAAVMVFGHRWVMPIVLSVRHRLRVERVADEGPGVVTVVLAGRDLELLRVQAGQFFVLRALTPGRWWKAHPFSLSAPPDGHTLRFTIKALGDDTTDLQTIPIGTPFAIEGPYGGFLPYRSSSRKLLYIASGVGITPFRGIIDDTDRPEDVVLIYRNRSRRDAVFIDDLEGLSQAKGFGLHLSFSRIGERDHNPFLPGGLEELVPDVADREVFVVGSSSLISAARSALRAAGVPGGQIHYENFAY